MAFCDVRDQSFSSRRGPSTEAQLRRFPAINMSKTARTRPNGSPALSGAEGNYRARDMETKNRRSSGSGVGIGFVPQPLCQTLT